VHPQGRARVKFGGGGDLEGGVAIVYLVFRLCFEGDD